MIDRIGDTMQKIAMLKHASALGIVVDEKGVHAQLAFHPRGRVDRQNLKAKLSESWALDALLQQFKALPSGFALEWTEIALQEKLAGNTAILAFSLAVVFVFLLLAALYESWLLPLAVILIVPMCVLAAMIGVNLRGLDRNILVEIGLVVLVGLAAKNAILIVEFAQQGLLAGMRPIDAALQARIRLWDGVLCELQATAPQELQPA